MAGAGFKTFNTGDVLTASDVNTYLMQQTVMVFADSSARTTALGANVAEGMISYLKDTNAVERYDGSSWGAIGAGDIEGVTAGTGLTGGGTSGTVTLSFDQANYGGGQWAAGKNKIINGDFSVNQRNFSSTTSVGFGFDRWAYDAAGGTVTYSAQTFTAGTAPVTGYESKNFARLVTASQSATSNYAYLYQRIEDVRVLANQTAVISFWAKANTGTPKIAVEIEQVFGTGGSPSTRVRTYFGQATLSTSWARYTLTTTIPSISGKTLGTNNDSYLEVNLFTSAGSDFNSRTGSLGLQNFTADIWGVQVEAGSTATPFQTATGTIQGELAACQRYYWRTTSTAAPYAYAFAYSTTQVQLNYRTPVTMRISPTSLDYSNLAIQDIVSGTTFNGGAPSLNGATGDNIFILWGSFTGLTTYRPYNIIISASPSYLGFSAEL